MSSRKFDHIISSTKFCDSMDSTKELVFDLSGISTGTVKTFTIPDGDSTIVGNNLTQTLMNKSIDADLNTITNIDDADIKVGAGIDAAKIHDGSVSNTEFGYLNGVTSGIQTQIDGKAASAITITAGEGISGGGDLTANRTLNIDINSLTADATPNGAVDYVVTYDASATGHKKVLLDNLPVASHNHAASDVTSGTFADARIAQSSVTQHSTALESAMNHDNLAGFVADEHIDHNLVYIHSGEGLTGSGNITANITVALDVNALTADASPDGATDYVVTYDASAGGHKKVLIDNLPMGSATLDGLTDTVITSVTDNEVLAYNTGTSKWINQTPAEAGLASVSHTHTSGDITDFDTAIDARIDVQKATANGLATLNESGKVPASQLALTNVEYQGTWNANTNTPTITSSVGTQGHYYVVSVAGSTSIDGITDWQTTDWIIFNGSVWEKADHTDQVTSVAGKQGAVTLAAGDITSGAFADARISQSSVTQHSSALESAMNHDNMTGFVANEHVDHSGVSITAGVGLSGGGTIAATRTLDLDVNSLTADATPDGAADYVVTYDASATGHKKVLLDNLPVASHNHSTADVTSGTFVDARISESSVTQHSGALETAMNHDLLTGFVADEHIDHNLVYVHSGEGLTGSGNITANVTVGLDLNSLTADASPDGAADYVVTYDASAGGHKKVLLDNLPSAAGTTLSALTDTVIDAPADNEVLAYNTGTSKWVNQTPAEAGLAAASHTHATGDIISGTFADARIAVTNVTQHEGSINIQNLSGAPTGTVVGNSDAQTLTNKSIDADLNTITNIDNTDIKAGAAIDASKIHDGTVSNTEFGYLDGVTSAIQTQLDGKATSSHTHDWDDATGTADVIPFNTGAGDPAHAEGKVFYDAGEHTLAVYNDASAVTHQLGQEGYIRVYNNSGASITDGKAVYISGTEGVENRPTIGLARADSKTTAEVIGITTMTINNNSFGYITCWGLVNDLDTSAFVSGDTLYLDDITAGSMRNSPPPEGNYEIQLGFVIKSDVSTGRMLVSLSQNLGSLMGDATEIVFDVVKQSVGTINPGDVVCIVGYDTGKNATQVELADSSVAGTMPGLGIMRDTINATTVGKVIVSGKLTNQNTAAYSIGDPLYVSETAGQLTNVKPTGAALVQKMGIVSRAHASQGVIDVFGAGRSNDLPNLSNNTFWLGDGSGVPTETATNTGFNLALGTTAGTVSEGNHTHAAADVTSGTFADARIAATNVTQHVAAIDHDSTLNFVANEHVDHSTVSITAGVGLSGGGTIAATRTLDLDINSLTADATPDGAADYVVTYDASATTHKKVLLNDLPGGGGGEGWSRTNSNVHLTTLTDNVGVGINDPTNFFEVRRVDPGTANHVQLIISDDTIVDDYNLGLDTSDSCMISMTCEDATYRQATVCCSDGYGTSTVFGVSASSNSGTTWNPLLVVKHDSKVGIGKNNPAQALDIVGSIVLTGTVDGRDIAADGSTLDGHVAATSAHGVTGSIVGTSDSQTLTNKTLTSPVLTTPQINDTSSDHQYIFEVSELTLDRTVTLPLLTTNDTFVFAAHAETLTNKSIDADNNTITNIDNADIKAGAAIDAAKIHDGTVSNTEFGYLNGVTSGIQTQFNAKAASSHAHDTGDITSGTFADARISQSSVTQHEAAINHDNLTGFVIDEHIDHNLVYVHSGEGLIGSGNITANVTVALDINSLTADASPDGAADYVVTYDASATGHKKVLLNNLPGGGGTTLSALTDTVIDAPVDNEVLAYNTGTSKWINQTPAEAGLAAASHNHAASDITSGTLTVARGGTGATNLTDNAILVGAGTSAIEASAWTIGANSEMSVSLSHPGFALDVHNTLGTGGGHGFHIHAGELAGDIAFKITDRDGTFNIMEMEANNGFIVTQKTYAQTLADNGVVHGFDNQHNGVASDFNTQYGVYRIGGVDVVDVAQTLTNKTLTSPVLTTPQINDTSADHQFIFGVTELTADRTITLPLLTTNDTFVFEAHSQTLTNKTINADNNTITNIDNADIKAAAAIDAAKIHDGTVSNTEFGYLNGVTSAIQTQIDGKAASSHVHSAADITSGTLTVARGGTGAATHTQDGLLVGAGTGAVTTVLCAWNKTTAPSAATDDVSLGYAPGSRWLDITADKEYVCLDATDGAAVWVETTGAGGSGETNTASNVGTGADVFKQKTGVDLEFRGINAASTKITAAVNVDNIDIDVVPAQIAIGDLSGAPSGTVVGTTDVQTLTNKTLTSAVLTTPQINDTSADHQYIFGVSELTLDRTVTLPLLTANDTFVFEAHSQTLTNKTINADNNTITNIDNADIKAGAAIDAAKIHDGTVSNTEFGYLNGVTSALQTQIDGKAASSHVHSASDITSGTLTVARGGTGATTLTQDGWLIGNGTGAVSAIKNNMNASVAPAAATDDVSLGYAVGSRWFDTTADKEYVCLDATDGAAVWAETTAGADGDITWQNAWVTSTAYTTNQAVENGGSSYVCISNHTSSASDEPGVGGSWTTYWDLMAQQGSQGPAGVTTPTVVTIPDVQNNTNSSTYVAISCFVFPGTASYTPTSIKAVTKNDSGVTGQYRIYDATNSLVIAESATYTENTVTIKDAGTISNLPASEAIFEVQFKRVAGSGSSKTILRSVTFNA